MVLALVNVFVAVVVVLIVFVVVIVILFVVILLLFSLSLFVGNSEGVLNRAGEEEFPNFLTSYKAPFSSILFLICGCTGYHSNYNWN